MKYRLKVERKLRMTKIKNISYTTNVSNDATIFVSYSYDNSNCLLDQLRVNSLVIDDKITAQKKE